MIRLPQWQGGSFSLSEAGMPEQSNAEFVRLASLLKASYRLQSLEARERAFIEHPAGRKFQQWRLMVYEDGLVVGMAAEKGGSPMRITRSEDEQFWAFLRHGAAGLMARERRLD